MLNGVESRCRPFSPDRFGIVFFSRGRGRGHAIPDMSIQRSVQQTYAEVDIRFVSYSAGAQAFRACAYDVIDLGLSDDVQLVESMVLQARVISRLQPRLVVAHEELAGLAAANIFCVPCMLITDFFADPNPAFVRALEYADEIVFTGEAGVFTEPPHLRAPIHYVGPAVRRLEYGRSDRERARQEVGVPEDATVLLCQPGNYPESTVPLVKTLISAYDALPFANRRLIWIAARDYDMLRLRFRGRSDIALKREDWKLDRLMAASDVIITKANRQTVYEAASLGLPSISISNGINWPDDVAVAHVKSNSALHARTVTDRVLGDLILDKINGGWLPEQMLPKWDGIGGAARCICDQVKRIDRSGALSSPTKPT